MKIRIRLRFRWRWLDGSPHYEVMEYRHLPDGTMYYYSLGTLTIYL